MNSNTASINLDEDKVYVVKDKKLKVVNPPLFGHGKQTIVWNDGKVNLIKHETTEKV